MLKWFVSPKQRQDFIMGYEESFPFLDKDYLEYACLYFLILNSRIKIKASIPGIEKNMELLRLAREEGMLI